MKKTGKYCGTQMNLFGEWDSGSPTVSGTDVFGDRGGRVSRQWRSDCKRSRALTGDLLSEIADLPNLEAALRRVVKNGGSAGVDGMSVRELKVWFSGNYRELRSQLLTGNYVPEAVKGVEIPKPKGGMRQLGIPTVRDRLVQQAISQVLMKHYEPIFSAYSYGFRPSRNAHQALHQAGRYAAAGYRRVVDIDLEKFFDRVNHDRLLWLLSTRISDGKLLKLIGKFLRTGILKGGLCKQRISGTPQGSPLSPLLSNIVLDELDKELERRGHRFVRYADDLIILVGSEAAARRVLASVSHYIEARLRLKVNREKSRICRTIELNFLGHRILYDGNLGLSKASEQRFKSKIKQITSRRRGISLEQMIKELNPVLRGWLNYFRYAKMHSRLLRLMGWLRRRIRCFRLKQCKRAIGIVRFLRRLGVVEWRAWLLALSGKGWYRKSCSPQSHEGMNDQWFTRIGLINMAAYYRSNFEETAQYESMLGGVRGQ
jgi:RNA-directed DNA polymerase